MHSDAVVVELMSTAQSVLMSSPDGGRTARVSPANKALLEKARRTYKTYDASANTEYRRLHELNQKRPLTVNTNPAEHATFYHLCAIRMQGEIL